MSHPYARSYFLPFPAAEIVLRLPEGDRSGPLLALIDSGADMTIIPTASLDEIGAQSEGDGILRDQWSGRHPINFYTIDLEMGNFTLPGIVVAGDQFSKEIILGRNVLNKLVLLLDGPSLQTEIYESRPRIFRNS